MKARQQLSVFAVVVAFGIAWLLIRLEVPGRRFIEMSLWFGFVLPSVPMMLGWILLLDPHFGLINLALMKLPFIDGPVFTIYSATGIIWVHLALTTVPVMDPGGCAGVVCCCPGLCAWPCWPPWENAPTTSRRLASVAAAKVP